MRRSLFRQVALERFLSPVETDSLRALVAPRRWLLAAGMFALLAAVLVWTLR